MTQLAATPLRVVLEYTSVEDWNNDPERGNLPYAVDSVVYWGLTDEGYYASWGRSWNSAVMGIAPWDYLHPVMESAYGFTQAAAPSEPDPIITQGMFQQYEAYLGNPSITQPPQAIQLAGGYIVG